jgi:Transcription factor TFIID (or TATA-binding protein, TBP)
MDTPRLSTMVVLYNTNLKFDTTKLVELLPLSYGIIRVEKRGVLRKGESKRDQIKRRSKKETSTNTTGFGNNSMTLVMMNDGDGTLLRKEITVKIFQNGVFHMTGILDDKYDTSVMTSLLNILWTDCRESITECPEKYEVTNRRVVLMNYTTKLHVDSVPRQALYSAIRRMNEEHVKAEYDPDVYPGVKVRIGPNKWIAKIFRTGKVILTGITTKEQCVEFVEQLTALLSRAFASASLHNSSTTSSASASASR